MPGLTRGVLQTGTGGDARPATQILVRLGLRFLRGHWYDHALCNARVASSEVLSLLVSALHGMSPDLAPPAWAAPERYLEVYAIDVEGGQSTLIVSPSGESMLIDTGWPGFDGRDAARIGAAAKAAGVSKLDYVLITHFHRDHVGGVPQLAGRTKIGTFVDHGKSLEDSDVTREDYAAYEKAVAGAKRMSPKPGNRIPMHGARG